MRAAFIASSLLALALAPGLAAAETIAIVGGKVHPVSGPPIENGTVVITDGTITAVGASVTVPADARRIDAAGKWVTPGLIAASSALGLTEIGQVRETNEMSARGEEAVSAAFRVWDGLNPQSVLWAPTSNEGITSVVVTPAGGLVAGQAAFVDLVTGTREQMVRRAPVAMVGQIDDSRSAETNARGELLMRLRELLEDARVFAQRRQAYEAANTRAFASGRLHLEALIPVVEGKLPLMLAADKASDVIAALDLAREYKLRLILIGGAEAWQVADRLAAAKVPVITGALENIPSTFTTLGSRQENAALLRKAGVDVAIVSGAGEAFNVRNLRQHAGNAVAYGLSWDEALAAVTIAPARIFGVEASLGTLQPGRDANVVVWSGDPFEFSTRAEHVFVKGQDVKRPSRQDMLTERYRIRR